MDGEDTRQIPMGVLLVAIGSLGNRLLFMHPYSPVAACESAQRSSSYREKRNTPMLVTGIIDQKSSQTQFGLTTGMLSEMLSVKSDSCDQPFEIKVDNVRFVGYPKSVTDPDPAGDSQTTSSDTNDPNNTNNTEVTNSTPLSTIFFIVFVLPASVDFHIVEAFQVLSKKLALAIDSLQSMNGYFSEQERMIRHKLDAMDDLVQKTCVDDFEVIAKENKLAQMLCKVYEDVGRTGVVQVFVDDFIEVGFCVESRAFMHAHLAPKNRSEIDRLVRMIRPYHGILLLEDVWPTPDGNPSVTLLLKHCSPDRSILDISISSGIPLLQVFLIVRHLLLWARAVVIYPLCDTNVYTCASRDGPLEKPIERFSKQISSSVHLAAALAHFNPPKTLESFVTKKRMLADQQGRAKVIVFLLRHQLIMQLHKFCYILPPYSDATLPRSGRHCPDALRSEINAGELMDDVRPIVSDICGQMLEKESFSKVERRLKLFLRMAPYMKGLHHVEDIIYRLNEDRVVVEDVIEAFSLVLSTFLRPDYIAE